MTALVEVRFEPQGKWACVPVGKTLLEAAEAAGVEIDTCCTGGMCGTDPVWIRDGLDGLAPAEHPEVGTLERMGLEEGYRLSCSARVVSGAITVEIADPDLPPRKANTP